MKPIRSGLCPFPLVLLLAACSSAPPYAALPIEDDAEATANVVVADSSLLDVVRIGRTGVERVAGSNQLKVMVPIRNIDDEPILVLVQTSFLDGQKNAIGDDTNQQIKLISPGSTLPVIVLSRTDFAQDWIMRISWNK